jgi:hypothetical protein
MQVSRLPRTIGARVVDQGSETTLEKCQMKID